MSGLNAPAPNKRSKLKELSVCIDIHVRVCVWRAKKQTNQKTKKQKNFEQILLSFFAVYD